MPNYQNGKIYKIESFIGNCIYYGSTTQPLCKRQAEHKKRYRYGTLQESSKQVLQYDDAKIYLVELYPCNSKEELYSREGFYIKNNECVNKCVAGRTKKEYRLDNKEKIKLYKTKPYTCECGKTIQINAKSNHNRSQKHLKYVNNLI